MAAISSNRLLLAILTVALGYFVMGHIAPDPNTALVAALFQFGMGLLVMWRFRTDAYNVLFRQARNPEEPGSHLVIIGIYFAALGSVYSGGYGFLWNAGLLPGHWSGSWITGIGRMITAGGFGMLVYSPDAVKRGLNLRPSLFIIASGLALLALFGMLMFSFGVKVGKQDNVGGFNGLVHRESAPTYPDCGEGETIWGSTSGKYHDQNSPYIGMLKGPSRCFTSPEQAEQHGFQPPG